MVGDMFMYQGEKQDSMVSVNDKLGNLVNGVKGERSWMWPALSSTISASAAGLPLPLVAGAAAVSGLVGYLFNGRWLRGKSVPAEANA